MTVKSESAVKIVGAIAAAIFILAMIVLMGMGDYGFFAALFLSLLIALLAAIVIYLAFGGGATATAPVHVAKPAPVAAPNPAPTAPKPAAAPAAAARFLAPSITSLGYVFMPFNRRGHDSVSTYDSRDCVGGAW